MPTSSLRKKAFIMTLWVNRFIYAQLTQQANLAHKAYLYIVAKSSVLLTNQNNVIYCFEVDSPELEGVNPGL